MVIFYNVFFSIYLSQISIENISNRSQISSDLYNMTIVEILTELNASDNRLNGTGY